MGTMKAHRAVLVFTLVVGSGQCEAQLRNANWIFSHWVQFGYGSAQVLPSINQAASNAASLSDPLGNLIAYVGVGGTGVVLRCADGSVMPSSPAFLDYVQAGTQSSLFLPWPNDTTKLAIFLRYTEITDPPYGHSHLSVASVDMSANGGLGAVLSPPMHLGDSMAHKLTAVPHANGQDYWVLVQKAASDVFLSYRLSPNGIDTVPVISHAGSVLPESVGGFPVNPMIHGNLVANYAGDALVSVSFSANPAWPDTSITELFHFNDTTGVVTFWAALDSNRTFMGEGGAEFSPDGSKLYVAEMPYLTNTVQLVQYDLSDPKPSEIRNSATILEESLGSPDLLLTAVPIAGAPDGRIYIGKGAGAQYLAVVEHPDSAGFACGLQANGLFLPNANAGFIAMPNFCKRYHDSEMTVGVMEVAAPEASLQLWPVPAGDVLNVAVPESGRLAVLDMLGREVAWQRAGVQGNLGLEVRSLASGTYLLRFASDNGTVLTGRFLKE